MTPVTSTTAPTPTVPTSATAPAAADPTSDPSIGDRFLTLLVTQLRNQDPLNPMDNSQMTSQLAQISTVTGINKLNDTMTALGASLGSSQYLQAAGLVGHTVLVPGSKLELGQGAAAGGAYLSAPADDVVVTINDANGNAIRKIDLGPQGAGAQTFSWDGKTDAGATAGDGEYTFTVQATQGGAPVTAGALMSGKVNGIVIGTDGTTQLQLGQLGQVATSQIIEII